MSKIAILDTNIFSEELHCNTFSYYNVLSEKDDSAENESCSHGTICSYLLDINTTDYELVNIQVLQNAPLGEGKPRGSIENLRSGLLLCDKLDVDIVCLSAGSTMLSDAMVIYDIVRKLSKDKIIIAAQDNSQHITIPTYFPFVLGVQSDRLNYLKPGEIFFCRDELFQTDVYANCNFKVLKEKFGCTPSNSFAVPIVAAAINNWFRDGDLQEIINENLDKNKWEDYSHIVPSKLMSRQREIPIILLYGDDSERGYKISQGIMDELFAHYDVQTSCLCSAIYSFEKFDIRMKIYTSPMQDIMIMQEYYRTDLIIVLMCTGDYKRYNKTLGYDICIKMKRDTELCDIRYDSKVKKINIDEIVDTLYKLLI